MRVFVTGSTGFIGTELVKDLIAAGHQVRGLTRSDAGEEQLRAAGAEVLRGDITDLDRLRLQDPDGARALLGDGNFGGRYVRPDEDMLRIWQVGVDETRALLEGPWE